MRKFYFLTITMVCTTIVSQAQITKGSTFLGGSVFYNKSESENENNGLYKSENSSFGIRPQFGKAIATNKIAGLFVNYNRQNNEQSSGNNISADKGKTYGGGIFLRNYYPLSSRFYLFGEAGLGVNFSDLERTNNSVLSLEDNTTGVGLNITPGISFAAGKKLHLEASLNNLFSMSYSSTKTKFYDNAGAVSSTGKSNHFGVAANANGFSQLLLGLRWVLPSKQ
jgi:hypothetical protein